MKRLFAASCVLAVGLLMPAFAEDAKKDEKPNPAVKKLNRDIRATSSSSSASRRARARAT